MESTLSRSADGRMPYFLPLDGVRAYCVLLVMSNHIRAETNILSWLPGHLGVDLFYLISGFLITTLLRREKYFTGRVDLRAFYWRRFFRIIPVYGVALALYVAVCQLPSQAAKWQELKSGLPYFLTMMNEYAREANNGHVFTHTWSLGVEEKFYLVWPILFFLGGRSTRLRATIVSLLLLALTIGTILSPDQLFSSYFGLMVGASMAVLLSGPHAHRIFAALRRLPASAALGIFLGGFAAVGIDHHLIIVFSFTSAIFLSLLLAGTTWLSRFHELPPMVWLGKRSYSMYLVHPLCLNAVEIRVKADSEWHLAFVLAAAYLLCAATAAALYRMVEEPARKAGRAYLARHNEVSAAV
jgi:peptidoglycan/LPS O-acetylase OafA/YrhL